MTLLRRIQHAWQRVVRGYDDTAVSWGLSNHLNQLVPAIKEFCETQLLKDQRLNPKRNEVYRETLARISAWEDMPYEELFKHLNAESALWSYIGYNCSYFWD